MMDKSIYKLQFDRWSKLRVFIDTGGLLNLVTQFNPTRILPKSTRSGLIQITSLWFLNLAMNSQTQLVYKIIDGLPHSSQHMMDKSIYKLQFDRWSKLRVFIDTGSPLNLVTQFNPTRILPKSTRSGLIWITSLWFLNLWTHKPNSFIKIVTFFYFR
jgi:hypothetical protein